MNPTSYSRSIRLLVVGLSAVLALPGLCQAQKTAGFEDLFSNPLGAGAPEKPEFTTTVTPESAAPGDVVTVAISVKLPEGYDIYSTTGAFGGRTKIVTKPVGLEAIDEEFHPDREPKIVFEPLLKEKVGKFFDDITWTRKYRVTAQTGEATISGTLTGQYCSGPEAKVQQCVPIAPPYKFDGTVQVSENAAVAEKPASDFVYARHVQPMVKLEAGGEAPAGIAWDFSLSPTDAKPGDKVTFAVKATLRDGFHTFSTTQEGLGGQPTAIVVSQADGLTPVSEEFQPDHPFEIEEDQKAGTRTEVYYHQVIWTQEFEVAADRQPGNYGVGGKVSYQFCDDRTCKTAKVTFALGSVPEPPPKPEVKTTIAMPDVNQPVPEVEPVVAQGKLGDKGLLSFIMLCLGGGFLALLTPCSFPMVPITVSFFLKQSESQHKRTWLLALVYCGSIVAAFTILGVGIAFVFGAAQLNALANIPWLNLVIGTVFVVFSLNMLGVFEIQMPGWLLTMTASKEAAGSYLGAVFMALTFTLTSFTCTFAIAGSLLVGAAQGEIYWPIIGMLAFGTAFAAPFFVLAMVPGLLKKLPKSGGWMNSVKVVMGLLELGAAVKFFSIADPAQVVFDHVLVMLIWLVLAVITAAYLFGWFRLPHDTPSPQISPFRMLLGTGFFILAGLLLSGIALPDRGGFAVRQILAFAPARFEGGNGILGPSLKHHGLEFALYLDNAIPVAQKENRPLLVDFTGVNCSNCRDMELKMGRAEWKQRLAKFIGVQLYVDVPEIPTITDPVEGERLLQENIKLQHQWFRDVSMPSYAVVTSDGKHVLAKYIGAEPASEAGTFVKFLDEGWAKWEQLQAGKAAGGPAAIRLAGEK